MYYTRITFPYAFKDTNYTFTSSTQYSETGESFWWNYVQTKRATYVDNWSGYNAISGSSGSRNTSCETVSWYACGY